MTMTKEQLDAISALSNEVGHISRDLKDLQKSNENLATALDLIHKTLQNMNTNLSDLRVSHANARGESQRALEELLPAVRALRVDVEEMRKQLEPEPEGEDTLVIGVPLRNVSAAGR